MEQIDPLVERLAKWLELRHKSHHHNFNDHASDLLRALSEPLPDGTRIVRTDREQTLPKVPTGVGYCVHMQEDMLAAGWLKCGPLERE